MNYSTTKYILALAIPVLWSCQSSQKESNVIAAFETSKNSQAVSVQDVSKPKDHFKVELVKYGKNPDAEYPTQLDSVEIRLFKNGASHSKHMITKHNFFDILDRGFVHESEIFRAEIAQVDTASQSVIIKLMFGVPYSDVVTDLAYIQHFDGNKYIIPASNTCMPSLRLSNGLIQTCDGVYTKESALFTIENCCVAFSCLMSDSVFFYVFEELHSEQTTEDNAYFVNIYSSDTLKSFRYKDYTYAISYTALMWYSEENQQLTFIDLQDSTVNVINSNLDHATFEIAEIPKNDQLERDIVNRIYSYSNEMLDYAIVVKYDASGKPIAIKI